MAQLLIEEPMTNQCMQGRVEYVNIMDITLQCVNSSGKLPSCGARQAVAAQAKTAPQHKKLVASRVSTSKKAHSVLTKQFHTQDGQETVICVTHELGTASVHILVAQAYVLNTHRLNASSSGNHSHHARN